MLEKYCQDVNWIKLASCSTLGPRVTLVTERCLVRHSLLVLHRAEKMNQILLYYLLHMVQYPQHPCNE
jgi:hypothetical protein